MIKLYTMSYNLSIISNHISIHNVLFHIKSVVGAIGTEWWGTFWTSPGKWQTCHHRWV